MPLAYRLTLKALDDLDEIWDYIAGDSVDSACRVESAIFEACEGIARYPFLGSKRGEITSQPVRFWVVSSFPNFIVVYRPATKPLEVVAILHSKRDIKRVLGERRSKD
jgi:plasmid stabilization system protein ParE